ncbi:MAG: hypothetical protein LBI65_00920 [Candidatus Symbiothrix sp.]|jgi:hypothetical protein|nr:hypothetical protein [Candidatus Symbiothrix sp.]
MMKKIAIIGVNNQDRMVLTQALSYITGYGIVSKADYSIQSIRYGINKALEYAGKHDLFIYLFASFSERIVIEQHYDQYVSNGSVLHELATVRAFFNRQTANRRKSGEWASMLDGAGKIITEYANRQYDCFIYLDSGLEKEDTPSNDIDTCMKNLIAEQEHIYRIRKDSILSDILEEISMDMKIRPVISSKTALERAQENMLKQL